MVNASSNISIKTAILFITAVFLISIDRFFKFLALNNGLPHFDIFNLFSLNLAKNYFIAFSLPISGSFLTIFIFLIILFFVYYLIKFWKQKNQALAATLFFVILGASSNLLDRIKWGFVVDYLDLKYFTIFNIADGMISCSVCFLAYLLIFKKD